MSRDRNGQTESARPKSLVPSLTSPCAMENTRTRCSNVTLHRSRSTWFRCEWNQDLLNKCLFRMPWWNGDKPWTIFMLQLRTARVILENFSHCGTFEIDSHYIWNTGTFLCIFTHYIRICVTHATEASSCHSKTYLLKHIVHYSCVITVGLSSGWLIVWFT